MRRRRAGAPPIPPAKHGGNKRTGIMREGVNALIDVLSTGGRWRAIAKDAIRKDLAARRTVKDDFIRWKLCRQAIGHAAAIQDRVGGVLPMRTLFGVSPFRLKLSADSGAPGARFQPGLKRVCRSINGRDRQALGWAK